MKLRRKGRRSIKSMIIGEVGQIYTSSLISSSRENSLKRLYINTSDPFLGISKDDNTIYFERTGKGFGEYRIHEEEHSGNEVLFIDSVEYPELCGNKINLSIVPIGFQGDYFDYCKELLKNTGSDYINNLEAAKEAVDLFQREGNLPSVKNSLAVELSYYFEKKLRISSRQDLFPHTCELRECLIQDLKEGNFSRLREFIGLIDKKGEPLKVEHQRLLERIIDQTIDRL